MTTSRSTKILLGAGGALLAIFLGLLYYMHIMDYRRAEENVREWQERQEMEASRQEAAASSSSTSPELPYYLAVETEGTEAYETAERESLANVAKVKAMAKTFVFAGVPNDYVEFCAEDMGFCLSYPQSWGDVEWRATYECYDKQQNQRTDLPGFSGRFSNAKMDNAYFFGATYLSYITSQECNPYGRGGSYYDGLPSKDTASADMIITSASGEPVAIWYGLEVGWLTHDYDIGFAADTSHSLVKRMAFAGRKSSSPDFTEKDLEDFLTIAHSYRTIPVKE